MATTIQLIPAFEANMKRKGRKQSTIDLYHYALTLFAEWAGGLHVAVVRRAIERGELRAHRLCSRLRIHRHDFDAWVSSNVVRSGSHHE